MYSLVSFIYDLCMSQELDTGSYGQPNGASLDTGLIFFTLEEHVYSGQDNWLTLIDTQRVVKRLNPALTLLVSEVMVLN